jgi:tRNA splicing endonuclease
MNAKRKQPLDPKPQNHPVQTSRRAIQLDQSQYQQYLKGRIDIYGPDSMLLESIGEQKNLFAQQEHSEAVYNQLSLVESLIVTSSGELQLTDRAIEGLATLLSQSRDLIE